MFATSTNTATPVEEPLKAGLLPSGARIEAAAGAIPREALTGETAASATEDLR